MSAVLQPKAQVPDLADEPTRKDLARVIAALFEKWGLSAEVQLSLLGMSPESRKLLAQYRRGERALPNSRDTLDRAGYLLGIHKGLRLLFPEDEGLRFGWVARRNKMLDERTPLAVMVEDGMLGLMRIARFVDFLRGQ
jgi:hypothetical protein